MPEANDPLYFGREQTLIKHKILEKYLERFAIIVGQFNEAITYIDGFSGPWNCQSEKLEDSSFSIALKQLRSARTALYERDGRSIKIRCFFIEKDAQAHAQLLAFAKEQRDDIEIVVRRGEFEELVPEIIRFIQVGPASNFPFIFIDPTGWAGFSMKVISNLICLPKCELLINFMTSHIIRFIEAEPAEIGLSFEQLYGDSTFRKRFDGFEGQKREDAIVFAYADRLGVVGGFKHVPVTVVPHPEKDSTHFHLIYATRSIKGLEVFKGAESAALEAAGEARADAKRRKRERNTSQAEFLSGEMIPDTNYTDRLRQHYLPQARDEVIKLLSNGRRLSYDDLYSTALRYPLVTQYDLRAWISEVAEVQGLGQREKVPKIGSNHWVQLRSKNDLLF